MSLTCRACGFENADEARYCSSCGTALAEVAAPRKERKFATALFADIVGSTALGEHEDPEIVQSLVGRAFDRLSQEVERYGGLLEKFMGDAVLAVFGIPSTHEDDSERAVRAGLEMQAVLSELNRGFASEGRPQLAMRIGVEGGEVLVDLERAAGHRDRMLTGDAVNTAARLETAAEPGHVVVGPAVYSATKEVVDYRELPALELKGKERPVPAWDALRVKARRVGERAPLGLEARLIGRDEELAVLKQTLHRVESEGRPGLVTVLGPAGVGKSRLAWELAKYVEGLPQFFYWRRGRCLAYGNLSYSALADAVKAQCEILEDDPPEVVARKVERAVVELFGDDAVVPHIRTLVGSGAERTLSREDLFDEWRRFLERMAARYPLVLVFEDIHWADAGLLDFIDYLADWAQGPIFVVTLARPELLEIRTGWGGGKRNYSAIYLDPLTPDENRLMLDDLLTATLPDELKQLVVDRSEGNPLFTEEIVRMLIDRGVLRAADAARWELARPIAEVEVPHSIHGLIAARLDTLPPDEKALLQDAAVVGRIFWAGAVAALSGRGINDVREILGRLRVKEIVVPREPPVFSGELEFSFRHVLIRDVAYESLPKSLRADKHADVARWAEERAGERREEIAELIATHFTESLRYLEELGETSDRRNEVERSGFGWARTAGDRARRLWQAAEAVRWYRMALDLSSSVGPGDEELARLSESYALSALGVAPMDEVVRAFETARDRYRAIDRPADAGRMEVWLAFACFHAGRDEQVLPGVGRALELLEPFGESQDLAGALAVLGIYHWRRGHNDLAEPPLRRSVELAARTGARMWEGHALQSLAFVLMQTGRVREGWPLLEEAYLVAQDAGDLILRLRTSNNLGSYLLAADPARAERILREGLELARKSGHPDTASWHLMQLAEHAINSGRLSEAEELIDEGLRLGREVSERPLLNGQLISLALIRGLRAQADEAETLLRDPARYFAQNPEPQFSAQLALAESRIARGRGETDRVLECLLRWVEQAGEDLMGTEELVLEAVRGLVRAGRAGEANDLRGRLGKLADDWPAAERFVTWTDGLVAETSEQAVALLEETCSRFEAIGWRLFEARCLIDLADAERRLPRDPRPTLERAAKILADCGATLYFREAEAALERLAD